MTDLWERRCVPARSSRDDWSIRQVQEGLIKMGEGGGWNGGGSMGEGDRVGEGRDSLCTHAPKNNNES